MTRKGKTRKAAATEAELSQPEQVEFGPWGSPPPNANRFMAIKYIKGRAVKMAVVTDQGVDQEVHSIEDLDIDYVRDTWGPGRYQFQWYGEEGGRLSIQGRSRPFTLRALPSDGENPSTDDPDADPDQDPQDTSGYPPGYRPIIMPAPAATAPTATLGETLQILAALQNLTAQQTSQQMNMLTSLVTAITGRERSQVEGGATMQQMTQAMHGVGVVLKQVMERLDKLEADDAGDGGAGGAGVPFTMQPGDSVSEAATAAVVNGAAQRLPDIIGAAADWVSGLGKKAEAEAEQLREQRELQRRATTVPAPSNGMGGPPVPSPQIQVTQVPAASEKVPS